MRQAKKVSLVQSPQFSQEELLEKSQATHLLKASSSRKLTTIGSFGSQAVQRATGADRRHNSIAGEGNPPQGRR